jgi:Tol biopolymer transport system component
MTWTHGTIISLLIVTTLIGALGTAENRPRVERADLSSTQIQSVTQGAIVFAGHFPGSSSVERTRLFSVRHDESSPVGVPSDPGCKQGPIWSADGSRMAFVSQHGLDFNIGVITVDSTRAHMLATRNGASSLLDDHDLGSSTDDGWCPYVYDGQTDASNPRRITGYELDDAFFLFALAPDPGSGGSAWLAFDRGSPAAAPMSGERSPNRVYLVDANGATQLELSGNPSMNIFGAWSPDGTRIGFTAIHDRTAGVFVMNGDGSDLQSLSSGDSDDFWLGWSPNGKSLAFRSVGVGQGELVVVDVVDDERSILNVTD